MLDRLISPSSDLRNHLVHSFIYQTLILNDINVSLLINRESSIVKLNRFVSLIMLFGD